MISGEPPRPPEEDTPLIFKMLQGHIRGKLKDALMVEAERVVDDVVTEALKELKMEIEQHRDYELGSMVVNISAGRVGGCKRPQ